MLTTSAFTSRDSSTDTHRKTCAQQVDRHVLAVRVCMHVCMHAHSMYVCMYALQCWGLNLGPHACWVSTLSLYTTCLNCSFVSRVFHLPVYIRLNHSQTIDSESCSPSAHCLYVYFRSTANRNSLCPALKASPGITSIQAGRRRDFSGSCSLLSFHTDSA